MVSGTFFMLHGEATQSAVRLLNKEMGGSAMTNDDATRIHVGVCSNCGRALRVKPRGLRENMRLTCKCGHINSIVIDQETLSQHGAIRTPIKEDVYQTRDVPLYRLLDGPRLRAMWAEAEAKQAKRNEEDYKDIPR